MKIFSKKIICKEIVKITGVPHTKVYGIVTIFLEYIKRGLTVNNQIYIRNFGNFKMSKSRISFQPCKSLNKLRRKVYEKEKGN